jgi:hypothetical protein
VTITLPRSNVTLFAGALTNYTKSKGHLGIVVAPVEPCSRQHRPALNQKRKTQAAVYAMQIPNHGVGTHLTRCERPTVRWAMAGSSDRGIAERAAGAGSRTGTASRATPSGLRKERIDCMAERSASGSIASPYLRSVWIEEQVGVPPAKSVATFRARHAQKRKLIRRRRKKILSAPATRRWA